MPRRFSVLIAGLPILLMMLVAGCGASNHALQDDKAQPAVDQSSVQPPPEQHPVEAIRWSLPPKPAFSKFLGSKLLTTGSDPKTLKAVDLSGSVLWSTTLPDNVLDVEVRSDMAEGLAVTQSGYTWLDLGTGKLIGPGPDIQPVAWNFFWQGDWLLVGDEIHKAPVDPKSPGTSYSHTAWDLYHARRTTKSWEKVGRLVELGDGFATMSTDGTVALIASKDVPDYKMFVEGRLVRSFAAHDNSFFLLTSTGRHAVERYPGGVTIYGSDGTPSAQKSVPGEQVATWGERIVLSDDTSFFVYDVSGREIFHQTGFVPRKQFNTIFLLVGQGQQSNVIDVTGRVVVSIPQKIESVRMTPDGQWVYWANQESLEAYRVPN
jgi:hypothetical protein